MSLKQNKQSFHFICVHGIENSSKDKSAICAVTCETCGHKCGYHIPQKSSVIEDDSIVCYACERDHETCDDFQPSCS